MSNGFLQLVRFPAQVLQRRDLLNSAEDET